MPKRIDFSSSNYVDVSQTSSPFASIQKRTFKVILIMILCFGLLSLVTNITEKSWTHYDTILYSCFSVIMITAFATLKTKWFRTSVLIFVGLSVSSMFLLGILSHNEYLSSLTTLVLVMIVIIVLISQRLQVILSLLLFLQQIALFWIISLDYNIGPIQYLGADITYSPLTRTIVYFCYYWFVFSLTFSLKRQITISAAQLRSKNEEIRNSYIEMEKFGHVVSHDLKSPIRNMTNFAGLISKNLDTNQHEKVKVYAQIIQNSGANAIKLIDDVLTFSKLKNDGQQTLMSSVGLDDLLIEVENDLLPLYPQSVVKFNQLGELKGNFSKLKILFQNLIENGLKYNNSETPIIRITREVNGTVDIIKIEDNGIGIDEKHFKSIFQPFKRLHNDSTYSGTGIGLASCQSIVKEHLKGDLAVTSQIDKGSVFTIKLPIR